MKKILLFMAVSLIGVSHISQAFPRDKNLLQPSPNIEIVSFEIKTTKDRGAASTCWDTIGNACQDSAPSPTISRTSYSVKVKNTGVKTVQKIWWRYVNVWPTGESYRDYLSAGKIKAGQTKKIPETEYPRKSNAPINPTYTEAERAKYQGKQIVIMCVEYTDGTIWKRS